MTAVSLMIVGCGGGGGGTSDDGNPPQTRPVSPPPGSGPPPSAAARNALKSVYRQHIGFARQPAYGQINADEAYVNLEVSASSTLPTLTDRPTVRPGAGVSIGLIDSGIDLDHPTFSGASIQEKILSGDGDLADTDFSHGTAVAGIIASVPTAPGVSTGDRFGGLAWGADITMYAIQLGSSSPGPYDPISLRDLRLSDAVLAGELRRAIDDGIDFLNMSIGYQGLIENYDEQVVRDRMTQTIATMDPARSLNSNSMIVVRAAGNANDDPCGQFSLNCRNGRIEATSPEVHAGLPVRIPELREVWVAVVSVDPNGVISSFSNRCGIAKDWCIAAPGRNIYTANYSSKLGQTVRSFASVRGTSFSAPMVTGGLALMKQVFRGQLSHSALLRRLYATADKTGRYANRDIYGQGLMDLGQATRPLGQQTVATGAMVGDGGLAFMNTGFQVGGAFGDGIVRGFAGQEIVAFDSLGSPFWYTLSGLVQNRSGGSLADRLARWEQVDSSWNETEAGLSFSTDIQGGMGNAGERGSSWRFGRLRMHADSGIGPLSLAEGALVLGYGSKRFSWDAYTTSGTREVMPVSGVTMTWRMRSSPVAFRVGAHQERASLLGSQTGGAFGSVGTHSISAGMVSQFDWAAWRLRAEAQVGWMSPEVRGGVWTGASGLRTGGFLIRGTRRLGMNDRLIVSLSQPMRVEDGQLRLSVPVGRTLEGRVMRSAMDVDAEPSGRQLDLTVGWERMVSDTRGFLMEGTLRQHAGHRADSSPQLLFTVGWRQRF